MIRLVHLLRKKSNISSAAFATHLRDLSGPLVAYHQVHLNLVRYVQTHPDETALATDVKTGSARGVMEPHFDGVAEYWWRSESDLAAVDQSEGGRRANAALLQAESAFIDLRDSPLFFVREYPQVSVKREKIFATPKTGVVKSSMALRALPELNDTEAQHYWLHSHGPLVRSHAAARGMICYQQAHRFESPLLEGRRAERGCIVDPYLGLAEAWFDRLIPRSGPESSDAVAAAIADERNFIDWKRSARMVGKEYVFVARQWA